MKTKSTLALLVVLGFLFAFICTLMESKCSFCEYETHDKPCLINLSTGQIGELDPYLPVPTSSTSTLSFVEVCDLVGYRSNGSVNSVEISIPKGQGIAYSPALCKNCETMLSTVSSGGYALADLSLPEFPRLLLLEEGRFFQACGLYIKVTANEAGDKLCITVSDTK